MAKGPEKESKILKVSRYIEKGQLPQGKIATAVQISKNHVSIIARTMAENGWTSKDVESMSEQQRKEVFTRKDLPEPTTRNIIICSQLMKDEMYTRLGVRPTSMADAIINRLASRTYDLEIQGDSMREMDVTAELERIRAAQARK